MSMENTVGVVAAELGLKEVNVAGAVKLLFEESCTIPFVARYRKEMTGSMDEVNLRLVRDRFNYITELEQTKQRYLKVVAEHCNTKPELKGSFPKIQQQFLGAKTKQELEDLYLPFKPKRRTRAFMARQRGLEPLCSEILAALATMDDLSKLAQNYIKEESANVPPESAVPSLEAALAGASDILAERISEMKDVRELVRELSFKNGMLEAKKNERYTAAAEPTEGRGGGSGPKKDLVSKYENYFSYREPLLEAASHRIMAVRRGESEKVLRLNIVVESELITKEIQSLLVEPFGTPNAVSEEWFQGAIQDAYKRLLSPSIETEIRLHLKSKAEGQAINIFAKNLEKLLLLPPIPQCVVAGIDPGLRTGSKIAIVSETGKLLEHKIIYPNYNDEASPKNQEARDTLRALFTRHKVAYISIGNGTGSRRVDQFVGRILEEDPFQTIRKVVVNEAGASVYSTDDIAREEFPDLDPTIRSAVSIARRLQDPLAELVKIDPRSVGVGQYQHDCDINRLNETLADRVESCVNRVGVNINTASSKLLSYVSGIGPSLARNIVSHRDQNGGLKTRRDLLDISGFGDKTFEQSAGFLRVVEGGHVLDNSSVHPERYEIVEKIAEDKGSSVLELIGRKDMIDSIAWEDYVTGELGMPTLQDIARELLKPGRDPRLDGARLKYSSKVGRIEDLKVDMTMKGTVSNVTAFGAFVDIGVHQDGLVHISELSDEFVKDPSTIVAVGDVVDVRVIDVDLKRRRISLSCKSKPSKTRNEAPAAGQGKNPVKAERGNANASTKRPFYNRSRGPEQDGRGRRFSPSTPRSGGNQGRQKKTQGKNYSMDDLLAKFND